MPIFFNTNSKYVSSRAEIISKLLRSMADTRLWATCIGGFHQYLEFFLCGQVQCQNTAATVIWCFSVFALVMFFTSRNCSLWFISDLHWIHGNSALRWWKELIRLTRPSVSNSSVVSHTVYRRRRNRKTQTWQHSISDFITVLYLFRKCIMKSTGANSLARRNLWIPPSSPCMFPKMLNWWPRYSWARLPPGEWVCLLTTGTETCQTTVRPSYFYKLNVTFFFDFQFTALGKDNMAELFTLLRHTNWDRMPINLQSRSKV